jgi:diguanylate cyclase (GGDEF)-like protein
MITSEESAGQRRVLALHEWELWTRPKTWTVFTTVTIVTMLALGSASFVQVPVTASHWGTFCLLAVLAIVQAEATRRIEHQRRSLSVTPHVSMTSVWLFPGAFLLPPHLAALLVIVIYVHLGFRSWSGIRHVTPHRTVANATTMIMSSFAAGYTEHLIGHNGTTTYSICAAGLAFFLMNTLVTGVGLYLAAPEKATAETCLGSWDDNVLELSTLCLGGLLIATLPHQPVLMLLIFLPLYVLQRSVLIKQLEELATTDQKTQLLNAVTWQNAAIREVSRVEREGGSFGALMIDLDFFKRINDNYGHLAGDDVLKAVAALVKSETRQHDLAGRFGGEEFVALLASSTKAEAIVTAERIRKLVSELVINTRNNEGEAVVIENQTASIGVAEFPRDGSTLDEVMASADAAVYAAKRSGRNRVVGSPALDAVMAG